MLHEISTTLGGSERQETRGRRGPPWGLTTGGGGYISTPSLSLKKYKKMGIKFINIDAPIAPKAVVRTRSDVAPLDSGIPVSSRKIPDASRKTDDPSRKFDGINRDAVVKKRGRPVTGEALSDAERARRYRARKKAVVI